MKKFLLVLIVLPFTAEAQTSVNTVTAKLTQQSAIKSETVAAKTGAAKINETATKIVNTNLDQVKNMFGWVTWKYSTCKKAPASPSAEIINLPIVLGNEAAKNKNNKIKSRG